MSITLFRNGDPIVRRSFIRGFWNPWEWISPPMMAGVEYRTTERIDNKAVYKKKVDGEIFYRLNGETEWKKQNELVGAAPAGLVNGIYYVTSLADFESRIEEVYNSMENCTERVIQMDLTSGTTEVHSGDWYITIARRNANNGFLRMTKSLDSTVSHQRYRYDGSWGPWTWETPLMKHGVEYRTTERYNGNVVYAKWLYFGKLPNSSYASVAVGDSCTSCTKVISVDFYAVNSSEWCSFPIISDYGIVAYHWISPDGYLAMNTNRDFSGYDGYALIKYTK